MSYSRPAPPPPPPPPPAGDAEVKVQRREMRETGNAAPLTSTRCCNWIESIEHEGRERTWRRSLGQQHGDKMDVIENGDMEQILSQSHLSWRTNYIESILSPALLPITLLYQRRSDSGKILGHYFFIFADVFNNVSTISVWKCGDNKQTRNSNINAKYKQQIPKWHTNYKLQRSNHNHR